MKKDDFIKFINGNNSYKNECIQSIKEIVKELNEWIKKNGNEELKLTDDIISDIIQSMITHMNKYKNHWSDDEKNYLIRFRWNVINWLYGYVRKKDDEKKL